MRYQSTFATPTSSRPGALALTGPEAITLAASAVQFGGPNLVHRLANFILAGENRMTRMVIENYLGLEILDRLILWEEETIFFLIGENGQTFKTLMVFKARGGQATPHDVELIQYPFSARCGNRSVLCLRLTAKDEVQVVY